MDWEEKRKYPQLDLNEVKDGWVRVREVEHVYWKEKILQREPGKTLS